MDNELYRECMELYKIACDMCDDNLKVMEAAKVAQSQSIAVVTMLSINLYRSILDALKLKGNDRQQIVDSILEELTFNLK